MIGIWIFGEEWLEDSEPLFMAKTPPSDNQGGESGLPELAEQENFWKRHKKDMKGWT